MSARLYAAVLVLFVPLASRALSDEPRPLPPELRWVSADSVAFAHLRFAELWDSPAGKALRQYVLALEPNTFEKFEREFGVAPEQIDRLTLVVPDLEADAHELGIVLRLTTREPYDRARLARILNLSGREDRPRTQGGAKTLFRRDRNGTYVHLGDARTITHLYTDAAAGLAARLLEGETSGRLNPALQAAADGDTLVVALDGSRLRDRPRWLELPLDLAPALDAGLVTLRGRLKGNDAALELRAEYSEQTLATLAGTAVTAVRSRRLSELDQHRKELQSAGDDPFELRLITALRDGLKDAKLRYEGHNLVGTTTVSARALVAVVEKDDRALRLVTQVRTRTLNLKMMALAMHNYASANTYLPVPALRDANGKALLSWRVAILPYIEEMQLYREFHLDEPWDSEHNKKLIPRMPKIYQTGNAKLAADGKTVYLGPVVPVAHNGGSLYAPTVKKISLEQLAATDGTSNTILLVHANDDAAVVWTKPEDLEIDAKDPLRGLKRAAPEPILVVLVDGSVRRLSPSANANALMAAFGWRDGIAFDWRVLTDRSP